MNAKLAIALALVFAVGLVGCTGNVPASETIAPLEPTVTLPPTALPTEEPTATPTEMPTLVPTPTATPMEVVWEYNRSFLGVVFDDCRKFSGGPMGEQEELDYISVLAQVVGLDLDSPGPPWVYGYSVYGTPLLTRNAYLDPNLEYCYVVLLADAIEYSELLNDLAPLTPGLLVYETEDGEFVISKVKPMDEPTEAEEVWDQIEAEAYAKANCNPVDIGNSDAEVFGYAEELLDRAGFPEDSPVRSNIGVYSHEGG